MQTAVQATRQIEKAKGKKEILLKQVIENLINKKIQSNKQSLTRSEIEREIISVFVVSDKRSITNKFNLLWTLGYLIQPKPNEYDINFAKAPVLDTSLPTEPQISQVVSTPIESSARTQISDKDYTTLLQAAMIKNPLCVCFTGDVVCSSFSIDGLPTKPCHNHKRWPIEFCRDRQDVASLLQDKTSEETV